MRLVPSTPSAPVDTLEIEVTEEEILADLLYPAGVPESGEAGPSAAS